MVTSPVTPRHGSLEGVGGLKTNEAYHSKTDALVIPEMQFFENLPTPLFWKCWFCNIRHLFRFACATGYDTGWIRANLFGSRSTQNFSHYDDELLGTLQLFLNDCSYKRKSLSQLKLSLRSPNDTLNNKRFEFQNMTVDFVCVFGSVSAVL